MRRRVSRLTLIVPVEKVIIPVVRAREDIVLLFVKMLLSLLKAERGLIAVESVITLHILRLLLFKTIFLIDH